LDTQISINHRKPIYLGMSNATGTDINILILNGLFFIN